MQSNDLFSTSHIQSQLHMLYALAQQQQQQQISSSSPSDLAIKRAKKSMPLSTDLPTQVPYPSTIDRDVVKVVTTAGPQAIDKEFLTQLLTRKDVIPARKRRDFIPNEMKDNHYWERRRKNNLAAKRSREKRRFNDIVLETKVVELTNENESLKAKLNLMLARLNMKETDMETLFEEEQRLGNITVKSITTTSTLLNHHDDSHTAHSRDYSSSETHDEDDIQNNNVMDLSRNDVKTGNLLTTISNKSPPPLTPSPSPQNESLLQILANQMLKTKQDNLLKIASPIETKSIKRNYNEIEKDDEAAMALLSLNKTSPAPAVEQQVALQSVINSLLNKPNPTKSTIDYHNQMQGENFHHHHHQHHPTSFEQWKNLMNYFTMSSAQQQHQQSSMSSSSSSDIHSQPSEPRADMMPLKLRMKMLNAKS